MVANCSFCGKSQDEVRTMVSSPRDDSIICDECVIESLRIAGRQPKQHRLRISFLAFETLAKLGYAIGRILPKSSERNPSTEDPLRIPNPHFFSPSSISSKAVCNFCGHTEEQANTIIPGLGSFICDDCAVSALATICRKPNGKELRIRIAFFAFQLLFSLAYNVRDSIVLPRDL